MNVTPKLPLEIEEMVNKAVTDRVPRTYVGLSSKKSSTDVFLREFAPKLAKTKDKAGAFLNKAAACIKKIIKR